MGNVGARIHPLPSPTDGDVETFHGPLAVVPPPPPAVILTLAFSLAASAVWVLESGEAEEG